MSQNSFNFYIKGRLHSFLFNGVDAIAIDGLDNVSNNIQQSLSSFIIAKGDIIKIVFEKVEEKTGIAVNTYYDNNGKSTNTTDLWVFNITTPIELLADGLQIPGIASYLLGITSPTLGEYIEVTFIAPSSLFCMNFDVVISPMNQEIDFLSQFSTINGESKNNVQYIIKNDPLYGKFLDQNGMPFQKMVYTSIFNLLSYIPTTTGKLETILFNGKSNIGLSFAQCQFTIYSCYESCETCKYENAEADSINHLCSSCKTGYAALEDNAKSCFVTSSDLPGYVFEGGLFKKCYLSCNTCDAVGTVNDQQCLSCISNHYFLEKDSKSNCYDAPPNGSFLNPSIPIYSLCHSSCKTCTGKDIDPSITQCDPKQCAISLFYLEDDETQCVSVCPSNYISDGVDTCMLCYQSCATCSGVGDLINHNCLTCQSPFGLSGTNCETCLDKWYNDNRGEKICTNICPITHPLLIVSTKECIDSNCFDHALVEYDDTCISKCPPTHQEISSKCELIPTPPITPPNDIIVNEKLDDFIKDFQDKIEDIYNSGKDIIGDDFIIQITNNTKNKTDKEGSSSIDLGDCEEILRNVYSIPESDPLIIVKIDIILPSYPTNQIEYDVYDKNFNKLSLSYCNKIEITYPIINDTGLNLTKGEEMLDKGIDIFNPTDSVFNDICYPYNEKNTDLILSDRREDVFVNVSFCEVNCTYEGINYTSMEVKCICNVKTQLETIANENKAISVFSESLPINNIVIGQCYNLLFDWDNLIYNTGFWFTNSFVLIQLICVILYCMCGITSIFSLLSKYPMPYKPHNLPPSPTKNKASLPISDNIIEEKLWSDDQDISNIDSIDEDDPYTPKYSYKKKITSVIPNNNSNNDYKHQQIDNIIKIDNSNKKRRRTEEIQFNNIQKQNKDLIIIDSKIQMLNQRRKTQYDIEESNMKTHDLTRKKKMNNYAIDSTSIKKPISNKSLQRLATIKEEGESKRVHPSTLNTQNIYIKKNLPNGKNMHESIYTDSGSNYQNTSIMNKKRTSSFTVQTNFETVASIPQLTTSNDFVSKEIRIDLENCPFTLALRVDKRNCCQIYWDYLKENLLILRTFIKKSKFELISVNLTALILGLAIDFSFNALFYTDDIISERYHNSGQLSFWSSVLKSVYSSLINFFLIKMINCLSSYAYKLDMLVYEFKNQLVFDKVCKKIVKSLRCKLAFFFIVANLLLLSFWYYCTIFCIVYSQSQMSWLEGCGTSFLMSNATTMGLCLVITIIRVCSFNYKSKTMYHTAKYFSSKI